VHLKFPLLSRSMLLNGREAEGGKEERERGDKKKKLRLNV
jgi:hypothetical protein